MIDSVRVLKLVDGQEVIGRDYTETPTGVHLSFVLGIHAMPRDGRLAVSFLPFSLVTNPAEKVVFDRTHIIAVLRPHEDFARNYLSQTSGLVIPTTESPSASHLSLVD